MNLTFHPTNDELKIVSMLCEGNRFKEIADEFSINSRAMEHTINKIRWKYNCETLPQLTHLFTKNNFI